MNENNKEPTQTTTDVPYAYTVKGKTGIMRLVLALGYSWQGVRAACDEQGFRQLLWLHGALIVAVFCLPFSLAVQLVLLLASCVSLTVELLNTGIEAAVDYVSLDYHPLAKRAKDVGSAAQYLSLMMLAVMWIWALYRTFMAV